MINQRINPHLTRVCPMHFEEYYHLVCLQLKQNHFTTIDRDTVYSDYQTGKTVEQCVKLFLDEEET